MLVCGGAFAIGLSGTASAATVGSNAMLRKAASAVVTGELKHEGALACGQLYAPLATTVGGKTCTQRWDARSTSLLAAPGGASRLRADLRAMATAKISVNGLYASIALPNPLLGGKSRFYWTTNCWMLMD